MTFTYPSRAFAGRIHAGFIGYPKRGGQFLHYEFHAKSQSEARAALAKQIKAARKAK